MYVCAGAAPDAHFLKLDVAIYYNFFDLHFDTFSSFLTGLVKKTYIFSSNMSNHYFKYQLFPVWTVVTTTLCKDICYDLLMFGQLL